MKTTIKTFLKEEDGVAAIEYGLLAGLIAVLIAAAATAIGTNLQAIFVKVQNAVTTANTGAG